MVVNGCELYKNFKDKNWKCTMGTEKNNGILYTMLTFEEEDKKNKQTGS